MLAPVSVTAAGQALAAGDVEGPEETCLVGQRLFQ